MRKIALALTLLAALGVPSTAFAFHHGQLPSKVCADESAGSPSNDNGAAKEAIVEHNPAQPLPLPPVGTPGNGKGEGDEHCAGAA